MRKQANVSVKPALSPRLSDALCKSRWKKLRVSAKSPLKKLRISAKSPLKKLWVGAKSPLKKFVHEL